MHGVRRDLLDTLLIASMLFATVMNSRTRLTFWYEQRVLLPDFVMACTSKWQVVSSSWFIHAILA